MPTLLPKRQLERPDRRDPGFRNLMIAATLLVSALCLICGQFYGPLPGYGLAQTHGELQLSP